MPSVLQLPVPDRRVLAAVATGIVLLAPAASASAGHLQPVGPRAHAASARVIQNAGGAPAATTELPSRSGRASRSGDAARWLIGVDGDPARAARLARRAGGTFDAHLGVATAPRDRADALVRALGPRAVRWAGPDVVATRSSSFDGAGGVQSPWARGVANAPSLTPLPGTLAPIGIVDDAVDSSVAELQSADVINKVGALEPHGTMVASTAAAPYDGAGVVGVAPGARVLSWGTTLTCGDVSSGIVNLVRRGAKVINLSLGFTRSCFALWQATSYAYAMGVTMVVASGNDGDRGNPPSYPASYPHVITAAAVDPTLAAAAFSNYNEYVDVAAPGVDVPVDTPLRFDVEDDVQDGLTLVSGTSFASPFVAGGLSWVLGARPGLDPGQVADILRASSRDIGAPGWDRHTGFGLLQVAAAMAVPTPPADVLEPNDDPAFTRARGKGAFGKRTIWAGGPRTTITAQGDSADDPVDAYRVRVPAGERVKVSVKASAGMTDLFAFDQSAESFIGEPLHASVKGGSTTDTITLRNTGRSGRIAFVVVNSLDAGVRMPSRYTLRVGRG